MGRRTHRPPRTQLGKHRKRPKAWHRGRSEARKWDQVPLEVKRA